MVEISSYRHTLILRSYIKNLDGLSLKLRAGIESWKSSFLWPYIIPANIPLGIQYYNPGLKVFKRGLLQVKREVHIRPFQSLIALRSLHAKKKLMSQFMIL